MNTRRDLLVLFALAGWALAVPHYGSDFAVSMALTCLMYAAVVQLEPVLRQHALPLAGHPAFLASGLRQRADAGASGWWAAIALGTAIAAGMVAMLMARRCCTCAAPYFAVLTFGMTELIRHAITYWENRSPARARAQRGARARHHLPHRARAGGLAILVSILVRRSPSAGDGRGIGADEQRAQTLGVEHAPRQDRRLRADRRLRRRGGRGDERALDLHRPGDRVQPFIGSRRASRADRRRHAVGAADRRGGVQPAGRDLAPATAAALPDGALRLLLILSVLYLPGRLASLRRDSFKVEEGAAERPPCSRRAA